jgi:hypothetical protein
MRRYSGSEIIGKVYIRLIIGLVVISALFGLLKPSSKVNIEIYDPLECQVMYEAGYDCKTGLKLEK